MVARFSTRVLDRFFTPRMPEPYAGPARRWVLWMLYAAVLLIFPGVAVLSALAGLADVVDGRSVDPLGDYSAAAAIVGVAFSALPVGLAWACLRLTGDRLLRLGLFRLPAGELVRATGWAFVWIFAFGGVVEWAAGVVLSRVPYADRYSAHVALGAHVSFGRLAAVGIAAAIGAGFVEEIVVLGLSYRVLERIGLRDPVIVGLLVALRLSYHVYYGVATVVLLPWAYLSVVFYRRYRLLWPLILGHAGWDTFAILSTASGTVAAVGLDALVLVVVLAGAVAGLRWRRVRRGPLLTLAIPRPRPQWTDRPALVSRPSYPPPPG